MAADKKGGFKPVESLRHQDRRPNIPTEELRDFVSEAETSPTTMLYPRDPSLDPQLVWKGKDEQDQADLAVPVVPIFIQEKIRPQALIENLRDTARKGEPEPELSLFDDFDGLEFDDIIEFYQHGQNWSNRMILGDSLLAMTSLAEKEGFKGKVQMIYLDPPYGIEFGSNWQVSTRKREVKDGKAEDATRQPEQIKAFRDTWELGIHSYLAYMRDRLVAGRALLTESGSIFVQISDKNVHLVRCLMDEVFGSENAVVTITVKKKGSQKSGFMDPVNDYVLWYSMTPRGSGGSANGPKFRPLFTARELDAETLAEFKWVELPNSEVHDLADTPSPVGESVDYRLRPQQLFRDYPGARLFRSNPLTSGGFRTNQSLPFVLDGVEYSPGKGNCWKHTARSVDGQPSGMERLGWAGRLLPGKSQLRFKSYLDDSGFVQLSNWWDGLGGASEPVYIVQTNTEIVRRCILMSTDPGDLVLDPTCGSGTTAFVAEQWGRRWITIDTSRVALALARTRLMASRYPFYMLADSTEGVIKEAELMGVPTASALDRGYCADVRKGFVCRRVNWVTSSSIANNPDIKAGLTRHEVDAAIAKHAETALLHDRPYEDAKRIRVSGPFTVESLSPHRVLPADDEVPRSRPEADVPTASGQFEVMILDNLRRAGVQNTVKNERLKFDRLEFYAGTWLQGTGEYTEAAAVKRVAISIGPEYGTVGPMQIKEAVKEAVQGLGFDLLIVCGFAFDPHVSEEAKRYGNLTVLTARMNPDLNMGDELLKKTGSGNLFTVFGEPDIELKTQPDGKLVAEIRGLDVYDPTTGQIRPSSTDDIACWFIDSNYNEESFFVRHAYFTGADEPYLKLKKALKAEIDGEVWASLYSTRSRPFDPPETGRIAIKVINHYGDEVLKVYQVGSSS